MKKQTAGREVLGDIAPTFAALNDDVLFGKVWAREAELSPRDRSMITISSLITAGNFEPLGQHLKLALENGVTRKEIAEIITHLAFYAGWPKAWRAFNLIKAKRDWPAEGQDAKVQEKSSPEATPHATPLFPRGDRIENDFFQGETWLHMLVTPEEPHNTAVANVTFSPGARNNWHSHSIGQFLLITGGKGYYHQTGREAQLLQAGDVVNVPANTRHWHGAAPDSWFSHIAVTEGETEWYEAVTDRQYGSIGENPHCRGK